MPPTARRGRDRATGRHRRDLTGHLPRSTTSSAAKRSSSAPRQARSSTTARGRRHRSRSTASTETTGRAGASSSSDDSRRSRTTRRARTTASAPSASTLGRQRQAALDEARAVADHRAPSRHDRRLSLPAAPAVARSDAGGDQRRSAGPRSAGHRGTSEPHVLSLYLARSGGARRSSRKDCTAWPREAPTARCRGVGASTHRRPGVIVRNRRPWQARMLVTCEPSTVREWRSTSSRQVSAVARACRR